LGGPVVPDVNITALAPFISSILFDEITTSSAETGEERKNDAIGERQGM
jgi:hypothetical protein